MLHDAVSVLAVPNLVPPDASTMMIDCDFFPDATRAVSIDRRMHRELGASLQHVCEASRHALAFDEQGLARLVDHLLNGGQVGPSTFARYYELVEALMDDRAGQADRLFSELAGTVLSSPGFQVVALGSPQLGEDSERYTRMMNSDQSIELGFQAPDPIAAAAFEHRLQRGLALLDNALPELAGEIRAIVRQIVIAGSDPTKKMQFDGGSHFQLWGALFLNCNYHHDDIAVAEVLAHESAHSLLFGFCTEEPLVENDDEELFASPLRTDLRPMDGIYHATFVSARMHWAMSQLALSPLLTPEQQARARDAAQADQRNFHAGQGVVREHGKLTQVGSGLMESASEYMAAAAA